MFYGSRGSLMRRLTGLLLLTGCALSCDTPAPPPAGRWIGDAQLSSGVERLEVTIDSSGRTRVSLRGWALSEAAAELSRKGGDSLSLVTRVGGDTTQLRGVTGDGSWAGLAMRGKDTAHFELKRLHPMIPDDWEHLVGTYRTGRGRSFGIGHLSEFGNQPMLVDYQTGRIGPLYPLSDRVFLYGSSVIAPLLPGDTADLAADGLRLVEAGKAPVVAVRLATRDLDVTFASESVLLAGTLTLPAGPPPYPAVVLVHGSNALTRDVFGPWTRFFAGLGYAVLSYDKRGTGGSTGDWKQADFGALAADVLAGVRFLADRDDILPDSIGLWGASQAGWIMPIVASRAPDEIAFMIVHAGSGTTVREQGRLNLANELRFEGLPESSVALGAPVPGSRRQLHPDRQGARGVAGLLSIAQGAGVLALGTVAAGRVVPALLPDAHGFRPGALLGPGPVSGALLLRGAGRERPAQGVMAADRERPQEGGKFGRDGGGAAGRQSPAARGEDRRAGRVSPLVALRAGLLRSDGFLVDGKTERRKDGMTVRRSSFRHSVVPSFRPNRRTRARRRATISAVS